MGNESRSLVGFASVDTSYGSGTPVPPPRQYPSNFPWSQQGPGAPITPEVALSQQSMMIPPRQPGLSRQSVWTHLNPVLLLFLHGNHPGLL